MNNRKLEMTQKCASAKAGISERSGRNTEKGHRSCVKIPRKWRTRPDPLVEVWGSVLVPMLTECPDLRPMTLLEYLQREYEGQYPDSILRTLERRIKNWKTISGPPKEVMISQNHPPGRQSISDFTELKGIEITINGNTLVHILYHFRLACSGWSHMKVILGGESFTALAEGLQEAIWRLGGSTYEHRTDSLSAAFKNLTKEEAADITSRYDAFCKHYNMIPTRNNRGCSHENGSIESPHGHIKRRIQQEFLLRGSYNFDSVEGYQSWLDEVVNRHNKRNAKKVQMEMAALRPLPASKTADYTEVYARVSSGATISVRRSTYTVYAKLISENLRIHLYHDRLVCFVGATEVQTLTRVYSNRKNNRARSIDYRHIIDSLVRKPQSFRLSRFRDDFLPSENYQNIWRQIEISVGGKQSCKLMVGMLHIAAKCDCEVELGEYVLQLIAEKKPISLSALQTKFSTQLLPAPEVDVTQHTLSEYDNLILENKEANHV